MILQKNVITTIKYVPLATPSWLQHPLERFINKDSYSSPLPLQWKESGISRVRLWNVSFSWGPTWFPLGQSLQSGSFHKPLILIHQRVDRMKTTIKENESNWSHAQPCLTQWNYEPCHVAPPKADGSWWRVLTKHGPLEKGMAKHYSILALRTPWTEWKGKKIWHWKIGQ